MISILIPIYNENCVNLVNDLSNQAKNLDCDWEILVFDDCSPKKYEENKTLLTFQNIVYKELSENIGRSRIRNLLAKEAKGDILIFLDGDSGIVRKDFLIKYLNTIEDYDVVRGGTIYCSKEKCKKGYELHWKYGVKVETNHKKQGDNIFTTNNFCIRKSVFEIVKFRENIKGYGHEDTLFKFDLDNQKFKFKNIDNPVEHLGLKNFQEFISSTQSAIVNLKKIQQEDEKLVKDIKLVKLYNKLSKLGLTKLYSIFFLITKKLMIRLLSSKNPSLFILNLYKLGVYSQH